MAWLNAREATDKIKQISQLERSIADIRDRIFDVLSMTDEKEKGNVVSEIAKAYENETDANMKKSLQVLSPFIAAHLQEGADKIVRKEKRREITMKILRLSDSKWKYCVYRYQIKSWGTPWAVKRVYREQIGEKSDGVLVTNERGIVYPENTQFNAWDVVYVKAPLEGLEGADEDTREKIQIQESYLQSQELEHRKALENFNKEHPMGKDIEMSFWFPVKSYEDIEKTLSSLTTKQVWVDPKRYEVVILLNRPNEREEFDKSTQEKILKFKLNHPEYNIHIFKHTFNFEDGVMMGDIYKMLWDTILYRNTQRKHLKWVDPKKIRNLIMKTWAADSTDKNPQYIKNQLEKYSRKYDGKELIRLTWESRILPEIAKAYPLLEIDEFFQRNFDLAYANNDPLKRDVGIWSYKAWMYADADGFPKVRTSEDTWMVKRVKAAFHKRKDTTAMYFDKGFIGAVDNSTDRWIFAMVNGIPYCNRYDKNSFRNVDQTKDREWNNRALANKGTKETANLELTIPNLERDISAFYRQRINKIFLGKTGSNKYRKYLESKEASRATDADKKMWIAKNIVNPIMKQTLEDPNLMGLSNWYYTFEMNESGYAKVKFVPAAIWRIKAIQDKKIKAWYYNYF